MNDTTGRCILSHRFLIWAFFLAHLKTTYALTIQGTIFDIVNDTCFIGSNVEINARDYVDCVIRCVTIFGHELCETASFNRITYSCQLSVRLYDDLVLQGDPNFVTVKKAAQECGAVTVSNGQITMVNTTIGSTALVICSVGYVATNSVITCQASGSWTEAQCLIDCGIPVITNSNISAITNTVEGTTISVSCITDYIPTDSQITCQINGSWTKTQCLKDCHLLNVVHADVLYSVPDVTYLGATAILRCEDNYALPSYDVNATLVCTETGWVDVNNEIPICWELMFRGTMGNGYNISDIYLYGSASNHASGMTSSLPECKDVFDQTCTLHYRNPNIDNWESISVTQVRYEFYNGTQTVMSLTIRAIGSNIYNWLEYGKIDWISLPWTDIESNMVNTWWAVIDWDTEIGRSFRVIENYGYCAGDILYTFVIYEPYREPNAPTEDIFCAYETEHTTWPQFMYTLNGVKSNFHVQEYGTATTMAIWVLHD